MKQSSRYHFNLLKTFNPDVMIAMVERSGGKTFEMKLMILDDYISKGYQSAFARRTEKMLDEVVFSFMIDITAVYQEWKNKEKEIEPETVKFFKKIGDKIFNFQIKGRRLYYGDDVVCYFISLNAADNVKGLSSKRCVRFYMDEMIPETGKYLTEEWFKFSSVISTMLRDKPNCRIIMASNALSFVNPYFQHFQIQ